MEHIDVDALQSRSSIKEQCNVTEQYNHDRYSAEGCICSCENKKESNKDSFNLLFILSRLSTL